MSEELKWLDEWYQDYENKKYDIERMKKIIVKKFEQVERIKSIVDKNKFNTNNIDLLRVAIEEILYE